MDTQYHLLYILYFSTFVDSFWRKVRNLKKSGEKCREKARNRMERRARAEDGRKVWYGGKDGGNKDGASGGGRGGGRGGGAEDDGTEMEADMGKEEEDQGGRTKKITTLSPKAIRGHRYPCSDCCLLFQIKIFLNN